jgi:hypothetical protein
LSRASCKNTSSILIPTDHVWLFSWFILACACCTVEMNATGASRRTAHYSTMAPPKKKRAGPGRGRGRAGPGRPPPPSPPPRDPFPSEPSEPGRAGTPPPPPPPSPSRRDPLRTIGASEPSERTERNGAVSEKHWNATFQDIIVKRRLFAIYVYENIKTSMTP